jgi:hypothetical protein
MMPSHMEAHAIVRQAGDGTWFGDVDGLPDRLTATTSEACVAAIREALKGPVRTNLVVEIVPTLAGVAEAAEILRWDKRRVITYIDRGAFPEPVQTLRSGRVWLRSDLEAFAARWRARHQERAVRLARRRGAARR